MPALIANPEHRLAEQVDPLSVIGTDPYGLGIGVSEYTNNGTFEVAQYELGNGLIAYISFNVRSGLAVVIRTAGRELLARRVSDDAEVRSTLSAYLS